MVYSVMVHNSLTSTFKMSSVLVRDRVGKYQLIIEKERENNN